ncbi:pyrroline-5-carboxylate reductase [Bosea sp. LjRoot9]
MMLGCGNMGAAIAGGYLKRNPGARILAVDPQVARAAELLQGVAGIDLVPTLQAEPLVDPRATIVALKPQVTADILPQLAAHPAGRGLVVSVVAGVSIGTLRQALPGARLIRAMPNTPALVSKGVTVLVAAADTTEADRAFCEELFSAVGTVHWLDDEGLMDSVTAVSGSGPAYIFAFAEAFIAAAQAVGLDAPLAKALVVETLDGATAMIRETGRPLSDLKSAVRSPAGTTDAALRVFEHDQMLARLIAEAVTAAAVRARELGAG